MKKQKLRNDVIKYANYGMYTFVYIITQINKKVDHGMITFSPNSLIPTAHISVSKY